MNGILIDPGAKTVEAIESTFELEELHKLVGAETLDFCHPFGRRETVAVDDNGMYNKLSEFRIAGYQHPIYGKAVIFGRDAGGRTVDTRLSVEEVYDQVEFE